jgi:hypothetical protein
MLTDTQRNELIEKVYRARQLELPATAERIELRLLRAIVADCAQASAWPAEGTAVQAALHAAAKVHREVVRPLQEPPYA